MREENLIVSVWRGDGEQGEYVDYRVPREESQTVLDVVTYIQRKIDPTLSYRFSCRVGMCGSCAMTVNGKPRWTCRTHVSKVAPDGKLSVGPLRIMNVVKDLSVEMSDFFEKWVRAEGRFHPTKTRYDDFDAIKPADNKRKIASAGIECIGCGICYSGCDVVAWKAEYLGPAALNRAWTLVNDVRDGGQIARLNAIAGDAGCHACHSQQGCVENCPKHLNPTASIAGLKRVTAFAALKGGLK
ncbi:MAG: succinate dehydrogenase/fumarate reductase iron-sulfur subunit [Rhodospirillaceae bacterium TMED8]|nr:succinate dehydrogenase/fumarate reductase iron-sulfur subunit [Magnetovibrio sp.]OUT49000.1 MAG: succinate dehydrogenase/fumarate reductase iron-sulfur subunit [Rhodospirillaceae bacterium TMED8]|tara:strand:+ start:8634 stop:9359 length:726 start_codon:yes stop_codon:yes gene_type:complete